MFTQNQIEQLIDIVNLQHIIFIATNVSPEMLSDTEINILRQAGINIQSIQNTPFDEMFRWGMLSSGLGNKKAAGMKYSQFESFLKSGQYLPLTQVEKTAVNIAKKQAANDIRGLGNRINAQTGQLLIEADQNQRRKYEKIITQETLKVIQNRGSISNLVSNLGTRTGDWARDFGRIADYVMTLAFEEGRAAQITSQYGIDSLVYKKVFHSACKKCIQLYLTNGFGSEPKVFKLSELYKNGSNIGRKADEWKPIIGSTHNWCRCMLTYVNPEYDWDEKQQDFNKPKPYERKVQRKSKTTITIGDKVTYV
jgi:hypothetical protein